MASAETKHTAGPWVVDLNDDRFIVRDANDDIVADCWNGTIADDGEVPLDTCEPNARLIAAAPELYETAAQAVGYLERICGLVPGEELDLQDVRDLLVDRRSFFRAALAKAEGR